MSCVKVRREISHHVRLLTLCAWLAGAGAAAAAVTDTVTVLCVVIVTVCVDACVVTPVFCDCACVTGHVEMCRSGTFTHAQ